MTTPGRPGGTVFQVVGTTPGIYGTDVAGNTVQGHMVYFRLSSGQSSQVFIPDTTFADREAVAALVQQAAQNLAAVNAISGTLD